MTGKRQIGKAVSIRQMKICAVIFLCLSLIPLLWLGKYNVMCIDDYDYGTRVHDVWQETGTFTPPCRKHGGRTWIFTGNGRGPMCPAS